MAPKKKTSTTAPKLDLKRTLAALDFQDKDYFTNLTDDEKKKYVPLVLMRFMSSASDRNDLHEYHLSVVNKFVNKDFWTLSKHIELQHKLIAMCGVGSPQFHKWIPMATKKNDTIFNFVKRFYPALNELEFAIFVKNHSITDIEDLAKDCALSDEEISNIIKHYKKIKSNDACNEK